MFLTKEMLIRRRWKKFVFFVQATALACGTVAYFALLFMLTN